MHAYTGKVALVTGGAGGIGRCTALAFAAQGIQVLVADMNQAGAEETVQQILAAGGQASAAAVDVRFEAAVAGLIATTVERYGRLDYAFNNAGVEIEKNFLAGGTEQEYDLIMDVNVKGVWLCMKYELARMLQQGGGVIINTASVAGLTAAPKMSIYSASKHAVIGLTRSAAIEYAKKNIRVNAVCPGVIDTEMFRRVLAEDPKRGEIAKFTHPLGRIGQPEEVTAAVLYLCSDAAAFSTGVTLPVDGGLTV